MEWQLGMWPHTPSVPFILTESVETDSLASRMNNLAVDVGVFPKIRKRTNKKHTNVKNRPEMQVEEQQEMQVEEQQEMQVEEQQEMQVDTENDLIDQNEKQMRKEEAEARKERLWLIEQIKAAKNKRDNIMLTGDYAALEDDELVTSMINQITKCGQVSRFARSNRHPELFEQKLNEDGVTVNMAAVDDTALVIPFTTWEAFGLLKTTSDKADRDMYADLEINFAKGGEIEKRGCDPTHLQNDFASEEKFEEVLDSAIKEAESRGKSLGEQPFSYGQAPLWRGDRAKRMNEKQHVDDLRRHGLYTFGTEHSCKENGGGVTISLNALEKQSRRLGVPVFGFGSFLKRSKYPNEMKRNTTTTTDGKTVTLEGPPSEFDSLQMYHAANKRKMEVGRLWYKLFYDQHVEVQGMALMLSETAKMEEPNVYDIRNEEGHYDENQIGYDIPGAREETGGLTPTQKAEADKVLEIRDKTRGELLQQVLDSRRTTEDDALVEAVKGGPMVLAITELGSKGALFPGRVFPKYTQECVSEHGCVNKYEWRLQKSAPTTPGDNYQKILIESCQTWPVVTIGRTRSWLLCYDDVEKYNKMAWAVLRHYFESDIGNTSEWSEANYPEALRDELGISEDDRAAVWGYVETTFDNLVDSIPAWAQAYLSEELIEDDNESSELDHAKEDELMKRAENLKHNASGGSNVKNEIATITERARLLRTDRDYASLTWHAYPTNDKTTMDKLDEHGNRATNWAHEQLLRAVVHLVDWEKVNAEDKASYVNYDIHEGELGVRWMNREDIVAGSTESAQMYQHWHIECYLGQGVANIGQLCTCINMYKYDNHYRYAQGMGGMITGKTIMSNFTPSKERVSPFTFTVVTDYEYALEKRDSAFNKGICNKDGRLIVEVPGDNIWPIEFKDDLRYGDKVKLKKPQDTDPERVTKNLKDVKANVELELKKWNITHVPHDIFLAIVGKPWYMPRNAIEKYMQPIKELNNDRVQRRVDGRQINCFDLRAWLDKYARIDETGKRNPNYLYCTENDYKDTIQQLKKLPSYLLPHKVRLSQGLYPFFDLMSVDEEQDAPEEDDLTAEEKRKRDAREIVQESDVQDRIRKTYTMKQDKH